MDKNEERLKLLEQFTDSLGDSQSVAIEDVKKLLRKKKLADEIEVDEVMDYLAASGVTVLHGGAKKISDSPLAMYFKDIGDVTILGKEKELEIAYRMRKAISALRDMIPLTTLSISALLRQGAYLEKGEISIDEFTISSFRPDSIAPTDYRNDILMALVRVALSYDRVRNFIISAKKSHITKKAYIDRKKRFAEQIAEEIEFINPSFKIIEGILPVFWKISEFYQRERDTFNDVIQLAGVSEKDAESISKGSQRTRSRIARRLSLGEGTISAVTHAYHRYEKVKHRIEDISLIPVPQLLNKIDSLRELLEQFEKDREILVKANVRLVVNIARNYMNQGVDFLDLIQDGNHALLKAVERFDPDRGYKLSTYAIWWVRQSMIRSIAEQGQVIRLPAYLIQWARKYSHTVQELSQKLGKHPTQEEIAAEMNTTIEEVEAMLQALQGQVSLERKLGHDKDSRTLGDLIEDETSESPSISTTLTVLQQEIKRILDTLSPREAEVISLRFGLKDNFPRTLEEIGKMFGLSRERIRQIESRALAKLRHPSKVRILEAFIKE